MNQQAETNTAVPGAGYHGLGYDPTVTVQTPALTDTSRVLPRGMHIGTFSNDQMLGMNDQCVNMPSDGLGGFDLTTFERVAFNNTGPGQMTINSGQFATQQPMRMPTFGVPPGLTSGQMVPANRIVDAQLGNCYGPPQPLMGMLQPQGQQGQNGINSTFMLGPIGVPQGNQPNMGVPFPSPSSQPRYPLSTSHSGLAATTLPMINPPNRLMNVTYVPPEHPQGYSTNHIAACPAPAAPTFHTGHPAPDAPAQNDASLAVRATTPNWLARAPPVAGAYPVIASGSRLSDAGLSGVRPTRPARQVEATVNKTPAVVGEHEKILMGLLQIVYRSGMRRSMQEIFNRLNIEMHTTGRLFGQQLEQGGQQRAAVYMNYLMNGILTQLKDMPDAANEIADYLAKFDGASFATLASVLNMPSRLSQVNRNEGRFDKPETIATRTAALPAGNQIRRRNAKSTQKSNAKPAQSTSKAGPSPSNKAKGKDEREFTLTGRTRTLVVGGEKCQSHFCSDGQWRLLRDEQLEEAKKRTAALKANRTAKTAGAGVKRGSVANDDGPAKKVKLTLKEITPSTTVSERSSSDLENISNTRLGVNQKGEEKAQGDQVLPASEEAVTVGKVNRAGEEAQDAQPPLTVEDVQPPLTVEDVQPALTVELAERNYLQNVAFLNSVSLDAPIDVGPIPPVLPPADAPPTGEGREELNVMWLGQQMQNIKSSFG